MKRPVEPLGFDPSAFAVVEWGNMAAKMPVAYIENPPVPVSHLRIGEAGHIGFSDVFIDQKDLSTYIRPAAKLQEKTFNTVGVRRDEDGYRLVLHQASAHFTVGNLES